MQRLLPNVFCLLPNLRPEEIYLQAIVIRRLTLLCLMSNPEHLLMHCTSASLHSRPIEKLK